MVTELDNILEQAQIQTLFQPILNNHEQIILGYEALTRGPSDSLLHSPIELFRTAEHEGKQNQLELLCISLAMQRFIALKLEGKLFLNLSPSVLLSVGVTPLISLTQSQGICPSLIVIELTENHPVTDIQRLPDMVNDLKSAGFLVAIDDLGAGNSGLKLWSELRPDFVKLDIYFASQIDQDATKRQFVSSLCDLAAKLGCYMILEGVERQEEFHTARKIGIRYCQGYLFGKPASRPTPLILREPEETDTPSETMTEKPLQELIIPVMTATPEMNCASALDIFNKNNDVFCLPVLNEAGCPIGMLRKSETISRFAQPFGHSLYGKATISQMMDSPICIDVRHTYLKASQQLMEQLEDDSDGWFCICDDQQYLGVGRLRDLMQKLTQQKLRMAKYANPLTLLPGNVPIQRMIEKRLKEKESFVIAYCDLNDFKPYNDICGYERGDMVIKLVARLLRQIFGQKNSFIGHIGGDDFIVILKQPEWIEPFKTLQHEFRRQRVHYYRHEDLTNQGVFANDRQGHRRKYPLVDLSVGIFRYTPDLSLNASQVSTTLSTAKHRAKGTPGHLYCLDNHRFDFNSFEYEDHKIESSLT